MSVTTGIYSKDFLTGLLQSAAEVLLIYSCPCFTLVPGSLFDVANSYNYLKLSHFIETDSEVLTDKLSFAGMNLVYAMPSAVYRLLTEFKHKITVRHHIGILMQVAPALGYNKNEMVFVNMDGGSMDVLVFAAKKLLQCERFASSNAEEFMYFLMNICHQLNLNPENIQLVLAGDKGADSDEYKLAGKQFPHIAFAENPFGLALPEGIDFSRYFNLLAASTCVL